MATEPEGLPPTSSQASKWTKAVRSRLPQWIQQSVTPVIQEALQSNGMSAQLSIIGKDEDSLVIAYPPLRQGTGYMAPQIRLEFGARSTGEPAEIRPIACDLAVLIPEIDFPQASPRVMKMERTFWEKATAIHVFCRQARMRGDRFARHWHDLLQLAATERIRASLPDKVWLEQVTRHKGMFFVEKDQAGAPIDYKECLEGHLCLVPEGQAREALREDYESMIQDGILLLHASEFAVVIEQCAALEAEINVLYKK